MALGGRSIVSTWVEKWWTSSSGKWMIVGAPGTRAHEYCWLPVERLGSETRDQVDSRSPVDLWVLPIIDDLLNNIKVERLG